MGFLCNGISTGWLSVYIGSLSISLNSICITRTIRTWPKVIKSRWITHWRLQNPLHAQKFWLTYMLSFSSVQTELGPNLLLPDYFCYTEFFPWGDIDKMLSWYRVYTHWICIDLTIYRCQTDAVMFHKSFHNFPALCKLGSGLFSGPCSK